MSNDLIKALELCLQFTPDNNAPGLNGVFFDFSGPENHLYLYATDGHIMIRIDLPCEISGPDEPMFIKDSDVESIIEKLSEAAHVTVTAWDRDIMLMSGDDCVTIRAQEDQLSGKYQQLFTGPKTESAAIDFDRLQKAIDLCSPIMTAYKGCGPVFKVEVFTKTYGDKANVLIVEPKLHVGFRAHIVIMSVPV